MNTIDLPPLLRECVDANVEPVSFGEIRTRAELTGRAERRAPARRRTLLGTAGAGLVAAGIAGALVASQAGGGAASLVLTAATLKQMASASHAAMTSGQADIDWTASGLPGQHRRITFDGGNWNDVVGRSISRVVDGQEFHNPAFTRAAHGMGIKPGWMRVLIPGSVPSLNIPDPRTLLSVLSPAAGFVADGSTTENGVRLEHLRAATPRAVSLAPLNPLIASEPDDAYVSALDLWVDPADVVLRAEVTVSGQGGSVTVRVTFSQVGQPQTITAPATYTTWGDGHTG
ncbi:MAG TPA: hypothetical protein VFB06_07290 [Streptosporangiaceae bacterium]|nr:hypothetical protein [Streptosporangiaceae bacterium]